MRLGRQDREQPHPGQGPGGQPAGGRPAAPHPGVAEGGSCHASSKAAAPQNALSAASMPRYNFLGAR
jgi:hypothetical protein